MTLLSFWVLGATPRVPLSSAYECQSTSPRRGLAPGRCCAATPARWMRLFSSHANRRKELLIQTKAPPTYSTAARYVKVFTWKKMLFSSQNWMTKHHHEDCQEPPPSTDSQSRSSTTTTTRFSAWLRSLSEDNTASAEALSTPSDRRRGSHRRKVSVNFHVR